MSCRPALVCHAVSRPQCMPCERHMLPIALNACILLVDAKNAFNSLNREAALHNIQHLCPAISTLACNTYGAPARLFVFGGGELASQEDTTQGDPLSMALYALSILPMQGSLLTTHPQTMQLWYADDSGAAGRLCRLRAWWDSLVVMGPKYGYITPIATRPSCL